MKILVTGGAGFIGSFIVDELVKRGHSVVIYDNLEEQVHFGKAPSYLNKNARFIQADMNDYEILKNTIRDIDVVFHEASLVGVGQSMYQIRRYMHANTMATSVLLDLLVNEEHNVKKLIVASSQSTYGEGSYKCKKCGIAEPGLRTEEQMAKQDWELHCPSCNDVLEPIPTLETKKQDISSIYALSKLDQEKMCSMIGKVYGIPTVSLRYYNVYGPRQSLSNPYTGVAAIFMSRIKNNNQPIIYEDGLQSRDFVSVHDVVQANMIAMEKSSADHEIFNVGSGGLVTIKQVAEVLAKLYGKDIKPKITNKFRKGDIRHCFADITKIKKKLGYEPKVSFEEGMEELIEHSKDIKAIDKFEQAQKELMEKKLI